MTMENSEIALDSTVRSQDSGKTNNSKDSSNSKDSKTESCQESKHSKEILISERQQRQQQHQAHQQHQQQQQQQHQQHLRDQDQRQKLQRAHERDDTNIFMFTSCGQLLLGVVLVVFGVLVLVHGASLGGSGAGLWAGAGALVAGALGVVATLATSSINKMPQQRGGPGTSGFATAHLASSLVALALSNMSAITALTAVVRDSQRPTEPSILLAPGEDGNLMEVEGSWAGLLASIGLLIASVAELLVAGYSCVTLTPKLCGCLRSSTEEDTDGRLKTRNMVHQWVVAQNHLPKNQPIYVVQPVMPMHPMIQGPYGIPAAAHGKYPAGFMPAGALPMPGPGYGAVPVIPHIIHAARPPTQMVRTRHHGKRNSQSDHEEDRNRRYSNNPEGCKSVDSATSKRMTSIGENQIDLAQTYTGLDKRISEEFISIAMDPDRKSKASSHHGSEIGGTGTTRPC